MRFLEQLIAAALGVAGYFIPLKLMHYTGDIPIFASYSTYAATQIIICFGHAKANRKLIGPKQKINLLLKESHKKLNKMQLYSTQIKELEKGRSSVSLLGKFFSYVAPSQNPVVTNINSLHKTANTIMLNVKNNPAALSNVNKFFIHYLDSTVNILEDYVTVRKQNMTTKEVADNLRRAEESISMMVPVFEQYQLLSIEGNMTDIDVESSVLKKTVNSSSTSTMNNNNK